MKLTISRTLRAAAVALVLVPSAGTLLTGCNDYLEEKPKHFISPEMMGDSREACDQWVTGVYSKWINDMFRWSNFPKVLELDADYTSGPDWCFATLGAGNFQGDASIVNTMWFGCYSLIQRSLMAEKYIAGMSSIPDHYRDNAIGEVVFNRAFAYFLLVRAYGEIPLKEVALVDGGTLNSPREPIAKVYEYITKELERAAGLMYRRDDPNYQRGHVCAATAAGMLAKVYATMASAAMPEGTGIIVRTGAPFETIGGEQYHTGLTNFRFAKTAVKGYEEMDAAALYGKAAEWAKKVIDGEYGLIQLLPYDQLWKRSSATDSEFLFSVQSVNGVEVYSNAVHNYYAGTMSGSDADVIIEGHWVGNTTHWYKLFESTDRRIVDGVQHRFRYNYNLEKEQGMYYPRDDEWTLKATGYDAAGNLVADPVAPFNDGIQYYNNLGAECLAFTTKYSDVSDPTTKFADANWPFLRYADVLLIYAEAMAETDHSDVAVTYLNQVRARSEARPATDPGAPVQLRSLIIEERAKELACEGDRRWDLLRWGIYLQAMNAIGGRDESNVEKNRTERNLLYPIPQDEINSNPYINANNPGWN